MLNVITHGEPSERAPLVIAHGLFGSARNWGVIARRLSDRRQVLALDMRNHGDSPWHNDHSYADMAADMAEVIALRCADQGGRADVLGHSMGGKAAMMLALTRPDLLRRLVVADIAPVAYGHSQIHNIEAMRGVDLSRVERRTDAAAQLAEAGIGRQLQSFFTQSLDLRERRWRFNLDALAAAMPQILGFPALDAHWDGPALFIAGEHSDYILPEHRPLIRRLFPGARIVRLHEAGHWLHADQPRAFEAVIRSFLDA
ncbi:alpha/beta fold hydrolase [Pontibaca methylaminivorans]|uniref:Pimeloyl-ACP methyl ester carboxylesterase n=1 Tax=Pontibaca methylaminivorans TaxID=515897 RepID=A0A1R3X7V0_9RHOB|nr:alpha/beta fold hydrolase [Pontibaca methylaminivorans]SIT86987.1 Pimeloyl-ACP methyl ester carboxylesterase [Pontibaca methylaminivorans]